MGLNPSPALFLELLLVLRGGRQSPERAEHMFGMKRQG
jgi:hypothetical protein